MLRSVGVGTLGLRIAWYERHLPSRLLVPRFVPLPLAASNPAVLLAPSGMKGPSCLVEISSESLQCLHSQLYLSQIN